MRTFAGVLAVLAIGGSSLLSFLMDQLGMTPPG